MDANFLSKKNLYRLIYVIVQQATGLDARITCNFHVESLFPTPNLLSDAEMGEDVMEDIFGCDFAACDFSEVMEATSKVFGNKVGGHLVGKGLFRMAKCFEGLL